MPARFPPYAFWLRISAMAISTTKFNSADTHRYLCCRILFLTVHVQKNQIKFARIAYAGPPLLSSGGHWLSIDLTRYSISVLAQSGDKPGRFSPSTISTPSKMLARKASRGSRT